MVSSRRVEIRERARAERRRRTELIALMEAGLLEREREADGQALCLILKLSTRGLIRGYTLLCDKIFKMRDNLDNGCVGG